MPQWNPSHIDHHLTSPAHVQHDAFARHQAPVKNESGMIGTSDAFAFLAGYFQGLRSHERIEVRSFGPDGHPGPRSWHAEPAEAGRAALALRGDLAIYYGVCPRADRGGRKCHVTSIHDLWADVDDKCFPDGRAGAAAALAAFPLAPTWWIDSGGGLQAYWQLRAPLPVAGVDDPLVARVEGLLARLYVRLGGLDAVQDLSRVMRVPGTWNTKYDPPRPVTVRHHDPDAIYTLEDFEGLLPAPPRPSPPAIPPGTHAGRGLPSPEDVRALLRHIPPTGDYTEDWLRVLAAVHSVYPGPEGVALCEEWSAGKPGEVARKFRSFGRYRGQRGPAGVGTLYHLAKQGGWRPPARPRFILTPSTRDTRLSTPLTPTEVRHAG